MAAFDPSSVLTTLVPSKGDQVGTISSASGPVPLDARLLSLDEPERNALLILFSLIVLTSHAAQQGIELDVFVGSPNPQAYPRCSLSHGPEALVQDAVALFCAKQPGTKPVSPSACRLQIRNDQSLELDVPDVLALDVHAEAGMVRARFVSSSFSVEEGELDCIARHVANLTRSWADLDQGARIRQLDMTSDDERRLLSQVWPCSRPLPVLYADKKPLIYDYIAEQVRRVPGKIAIQDHQNRFVTYEQLGTWSHTIAHRLQSLLIETDGSLGGDILVPLFLQRDARMIATLLAVLRAGAAYLPMEPDLVQGRKHALLDACREHNQTLGKDVTIITSHGMLSGLEDFVTEHEKRRILLLDDLLGEEALEIASSSTLQRPQSDWLAYVLFTSGSTGKPKGVMCQQGNLVEAMLSTAGAYDYVGNIATSQSLRTLLVSGYSFDISTWDIYMTLSWGGTLCVAPKDVLLSDMGNAIERLDVTMVESSSTILSTIHSSPQDIPTLRTIGSGAEPMSASVQAKWASDPNMELVNIYGPTEITVSCTAKRVDPRTASACIGQRIGSCNVYILSPTSTHLTPLGGIGEICVSGEQVGRGYLSLPEHTAQRFVPDPFRPGLRMYRTGDLGRWTLDGEICHAGRADCQLKVNGWRVESTEVESALITTGLVDRACVIKYVDEQLREFLVAYCCTIRRHEPLDRARLLVQLRSMLPPYMVPNVFVPIAVMPTTPNGKMDRQTLGIDFAEHAAEYFANAAPRQDSKNRVDLASLDPIEAEKVAFVLAAWSAVLATPKTNLALDEPWESYGGNSVGVIHLFQRLKKRVKTDLNEVIRARTIRDQAVLVCDKPSATVGGEGADSYQPFELIKDASIQLNSMLDQAEIQLHQVEDAYPASRLQSDLLLASSMDEGVFFSHHLVSFFPDITTSKIRNACQSLVQTFPSLRTKFVFDSDNGFIAIVAGAAHGVSEMQLSTLTVKDEDQLSSAITDAEKEKVLFDDNYQPRWHIYEVQSTRSSHLLLTIHHSHTDGWSFDVILEHLEALVYDEDRPSAPPISFGSFVKWCLPDGVDEERKIGYWRTSLEGCPEPVWPTKLSTLEDGEGAARIRGRRMWQGSLLQKAKQWRVTEATLVRLAFALVLWTRQKLTAAGTIDTRFATVISGRDAALKDIESVDGPCIATMPVRVTADKSERIVDACAREHTRFMDSMPHGHEGVSALQRAGISNVADVLLTLQQSRRKQQQPSRLKHEEKMLVDSGMTVEVLPREDQSGLDLCVQRDSGRIDETEEGTFVDDLCGILDAFACASDEATLESVL